MQTYNLRSVDAAAIAFLVLVGLAVLLAGNRRNDQRRCYGHCINNLRQIGSGYDIFTVEHGQYVTEISTNFGGTKEFMDEKGSAYPHLRALVHASTSVANLSPMHNLICPDDTRKAALPSSLTDTNISYFVSLNPPADAGKWVLAGNRNISLSSTATAGNHNRRRATWNAVEGLHGDTGFVLLLDGSIDRLGSSELSRRLSEGGNLTNRLVVP